MIKRVILTYYHKVWNQKDFRLLSYLFSNAFKINYINRSEQKSKLISVQDIRKNIETLTGFFPAIKIEIIKLICDNEFVSVYYKFGDADIKNAEQQLSQQFFLENEYLTMFKVQGGKICEQWIYENDISVPSQITGNKNYSKQLINTLPG